MTCVLLRGLTRESAHWGTFPATLSAALGGERVVTLDLPGAGAQHSAVSPTRVDAYVGACREQARQLGVAAPFNVVALSLGAMVAVAWAARHADEIARSVLVNTSLRPTAPFYWRLRPSSYVAVLKALTTRDRHTREAIVLALTSNGAPGDAQVVTQWTAIARARPVARVNALRQLWAAARFSASPRAPCPATLLLASTHDRLVDVRCSRRLASVWQVPLHEHPSAGHDLPLDDPGWVVAHVQRWFT